MRRIDPRFAPEGALARWVARVVGRRQLRRLRAEGLPASLVEPLGFLVERAIPGGDYGPVDRVEAIRVSLAVTEGTVGTFEVAGRHESGRHDEATPATRPLADLAHISSVPPLWGVFLHLCARETGARTILELGSAAGISGAYLATAPSCRRFVTVEGDPARAALARTHLASLAPSADVVTASFDAAIHALLPTFTDGIDLVFIDGNKVSGGYVALFEQVAPRLNPGAVVILDDIQWTAMTGDWQAIAAHEGLSFAIAAGRFGVAVWQGGRSRPRVRTLFGAGGWDLYGVRRDLRQAARSLLRRQAR